MFPPQMRRRGRAWPVLWALLSTTVPIVRLPIAAAILLLLGLEVPTSATDPPLSWLEPWVTIDDDRARALRDGQHVAETLQADGREVAVAFVGAVEVDPATFVDMVRDPVAMWKSERVPRVGRFSSPPQLDDVADMRLPADDVAAVRQCRPGDCEVKLTEAEITSLRGAASVQDQFRQVVIERVRRYLADAFRTEADYADHDRPIAPRNVALGLQRRSPWLLELAPHLSDDLERSPAATAGGPDSFVYWLETTYTPKPTIQVVHVTIHPRVGAPEPGSPRGAPEVVVVSRQIFASHYVNGSLSVSALLGGPPGSPRYLAYLTRADVDGIQGWLGALRRLLVERAIRSNGARVFDEQRRRFDGGREGVTRSASRTNCR